jgi:hypothetical protein
MKIKNDFLLRNIAESHIVVPVGERVIDFKGMMTLNETGCFLWNCLKDGIDYQALLTKILDEYEVDEETAKNDLDEFLQAARASGVLEE